MKRCRYVLLIIILIPSLMLFRLKADSKQSSKPDKKGLFVEGEIIVKYRKGTSESAKKNLEKKLSAKRIKKLPLIDAALLKVPDRNVSSKAKQFKELKEVLYAEPNFKRKMLLTPNDTYFSRQWGLHNYGQIIGGDKGTLDADIDAPSAWSRNMGSNDVIVAVADTGIQWYHPDLTNNIWINEDEIPSNGIDDDLNGYIDDTRGWDFYNDDNSVYDNDYDDYHATHVAGIIGAKTNNSIGVAGINRSVRIMPAKFLGDGGYGDVAGSILAMDYAASKGADVINASYGSSEYSQSEHDAIEALKAFGILFVAAAGNSSENNDTCPSFPANYELSNLVSVAASSNQDRKSTFSSIGPNKVSIFAPGTNVFSTYPGGYAYLSGTSMAAPHVTGATALLISTFGGSGMTVKHKLFYSADFKTTLRNMVSTSGRLNIYDALRNISPTMTWPTGNTTLNRGSTYRIRWANNGATFMQYNLFLSKMHKTRALESFEGATPLGTSYIGSAPWFRTSSRSYQGDVSFSSGSVNDNQSSSFQIKRYVSADSTISFAYKMSSRRTYSWTYGDSLQFYVDGIATGPRTTGITSWRTYSVSISQGWHTFKWVYAKDDYPETGEDRAWVDSIRFSRTPYWRKYYPITTTNAGASFSNWKVPSSLVAGNYILYVSGGYNSKKTNSSNVNVVIR